MRIESISEIGIKRKDNQDNYWSALLNVDGVEAGIVCLCDGMGGLNNGGLASRMVVEAVRDYIKTSIDFDGLNDVLLQVNNSIYNIGYTEEQPMGTTCTVLLCFKGEYKILHVGDTRCYLLRDNKMNALTTDHSALKKYGITRKDDEALWKRYKNSLTRCLGVKQSVKIDYLEGIYKDDDIFFLCSDGLWHYLDDYVYDKDELLDLQTITEKCMSNGETDNITAGILYV